MIAAANEESNGVENLWKSGPSGGRTEYPDFGQYMTKNEFKCFAATAPLCWAEKKHWFCRPRDKEWEIFLPCLQGMNARRRKLLDLGLLLPDESMSGWLPNVPFEPRRPVSLGTILRNGARGMMGSLVYKDVVKNNERQGRKVCMNEESALPDGFRVNTHAAEVLRQVECRTYRR